MKKYIFGIFAVACAACSSVFAVNPLARWDDFRNPTSGSYTLNIHSSCTVDPDTGVLTIGTGGVSVSYSSQNRIPYTIIADISDCPSASDVPLFSGTLVLGNNRYGMTLWSCSTGLQQKWAATVYGGSDYVMDSGRHTVALAYSCGVQVGAEASTYVDGVRVTTYGSYLSGYVTTALNIGQNSAQNSAATGLKVHRLAIFNSILSAADISAFDWEASPQPRMSVGQQTLGDTRAWYELKFTDLGTGGSSADVFYALAEANDEYPAWTPFATGADINWVDSLRFENLTAATDYKLKLRAVNNLSEEKLTEVLFTTRAQPAVIELQSGDDIGAAYGEILPLGGGTIRLADGTYTLNSYGFNRLDVPVTIIGASCNPEKVILSSSGNERVFVCIRPVEFKYMTFRGGNINLPGSAFQIFDGRVSNCIILGSRGLSAAWVAGKSIVENCLFINNICSDRIVDLVSNHLGSQYTGQHAIINCTIIGDDPTVPNISTDANGWIINCAEFGGKVSDGYMVPAQYFNCAGDHPFENADDWVQVERASVMDEDFVPYVDGVLAGAADAALYAEWATSTTDLKGNARFGGANSDRLDIGCCCAPALPRVSARVKGVKALAHDRPKSCALAIDWPASGAGCEVSWAWTDNGAFEHDGPAVYTEAGVYTNVVRITCEGYESFEASAVVELVGGGIIDVVDGGSIGDAYVQAVNMGGGVIRLADGEYTLTAQTGTFRSNYPVLITSASSKPENVVLKGASGDRVFVSTGEVEFRDLTLDGRETTNSPEALQITDGRISNCIIIGRYNGIAVWMTGTAVVENCLILAPDETGRELVSMPVMNDYPGQHALVNCTLIGQNRNYVNIVAGVGGFVINCAEFGGKAMSTGPRFLNCAGDQALDNATGWVQTTQASALTDDYKLCPKSPLIGAGSRSLYEQWTDNVCDLAGKPRYNKAGGLDIGCYAKVPAGFVVIIK